MILWITTPFSSIWHKARDIAVASARACLADLRAVAAAEDGARRTTRPCRRAAQRALTFADAKVYCLVEMSMHTPFRQEILERIHFPTLQHERLLRDAIARFEPDPRVKAMLLTNSLARNMGDRHSDLDFAIFVEDEDAASYKLVAKQLRFASLDFEVHLAATTLRFAPGEMDVNDLDGFEIRIGNFLAHPLLIFDRDGEWHAARARYLPYYDEELATARAGRFGELLTYQLEHGRIAVERGLMFEAAHRVVHGLSIFFAKLFVTRRAYPVDYQKRIEQQVVEWLALPDVATAARGVLAFDANDPRTLASALDRLEALGRGC